MSRHILFVLHRRLDASFENMERLWAIYTVERTPENFEAYLGALRRTGRLAEFLNA